MENGMATLDPLGRYTKKPEQEKASNTVDYRDPLSRKPTPAPSAKPAPTAAKVSPPTSKKKPSDYGVASQVAMSSAGKSTPTSTSSSLRKNTFKATPYADAPTSTQAIGSSNSGSSLQKNVAKATPSATATKKSGLSNFGKAFKAARSAGKSEFSFGGKKYNTKLKGQ